MRPIICDICGKTISTHQDGNLVNIDVYAFRIDDGVNAKKSYDMCKKCYEHVMSTVHNIAMQTQERK